MPVKENSETETEQEKQQIQEKESRLSDSLLNSLDLPTEKEEVKEKKKDAQEGGKVERRAKESVQEEEEEQEAEEVNEDDEDEEMVPKSKFEKRLNSEVAKRKVMEAELAELKAKNAKGNSGTQRDKLENMSETELRDLKREAKSEWKSTDDKARERQLDSLLDDIDDVLRTAPQRFEKAQVKAYNAKVGELISDNPDIDFEKYGPEIKKIAHSIYSEHSDLQNLERGQATALKMAFDHWQVTQKFSQGKSKEKEQAQKITKLKQKTSLDSGSLKGQNKGASREKAYKAAKDGGIQEKTDYVMNHLLDVDKFLPEAVR